MLSSCTLLLVLAAGQEIEKQRKQYLYAYDGEIHSAMTFDYHPDTLKLVLRTKNMFYSLPFAEYKTHGLDIIMNRSDFINYFPYIDPGFNLTYKTKKKDAVLLQHHPQKPHVFTEVLGSHPPLRASFPEAVPPERIILLLK
ncbi:hypothetical protein FOL47_002960 [Perkinsus chesapeaki]|uniref:Uncharacterized protein n=1 Tax=Perkinsus chesapeaki TaxID=330153 RepID=A0A7J6MC05_PERCH|nr:hypothetical protein FOL47_002960 [Perkinsus chesapeaki]